MVIILIMIIERPQEARLLRETKKWTLLYGRRKTGKSFLAENFLVHDDYFFVKKDRSVISRKTGAELPLEAFMEILRRDIEDGKTVVVDEFHRLGEGFLDQLHAGKKQGRLVLISSTLYMSKRLVDSNSALLGLVAEMPIWLISLQDAMNASPLSKLGKKARVELAVLLKEPLAIDYLDEKIAPARQIASVLAGSIRSIPALVGEIFAEEERSLSAIYDGVLRAVANGNIVSSEISSYLFSRKLIAKDDPSTIQQHLNNLVEFGMLKKIQVYKKNKFIYKHLSPLARIFYYADEKYNISERKASPEELLRIVEELLPKIVEDEIREFAAQRHGLAESVMEGKDYDVDACLLKFKKPAIAIEIKWKGNISTSDVRAAEENLKRTGAPEMWLFVPDKKKMGVKTTLRVIDIDDLTA